MNTRFEDTYRLLAVDVDIKGLWSPSAIFVRMQEIAEAHAEQVGFGRSQIIDTMGLAWVVTRMHLEMIRYPKLAQRIRVRTWPLKPTNLLFRRQFEFVDMDGELLGHASSQWVLFDLNDRILRRTSVLGGYPHDPAAPQLLPEPGKLRLPDDMAKKMTRRVRYSDVDMNGHMNNTKYLNWICELFPTPFLKTMCLHDVRINYIAEAHIDEDVDLYMAEGDDGYYICGRTDGKTVFDAYINWIENKERNQWQRELAF